MFPIYFRIQVEDIQVDGVSGLDDGRAGFVAPFAGRVTGLWLSPSGNPGLATECFINGARGRYNNGAGGQHLFTVDMTGGADNYEATFPIQTTENFVYAGEAWWFESEGNGSTPQNCSLIVEFSPGEGNV